MSSAAVQIGCAIWWKMRQSNKKAGVAAGFRRYLL
jgi:hypothetical protein